MTFSKLRRKGRVLGVILSGTFNLIALQRFTILRLSRSVGDFIFLWNRQLVGTRNFYTNVIRVVGAYTFVLFLRRQFSVKENGDCLSNLFIRVSYGLVTFSDRCTPFQESKWFCFFQLPSSQRTFFNVLPTIEQFWSSRNSEERRTGVCVCALRDTFCTL